MKGIAHFVTGVAVATFFPDLVQGAAQSLAFGPVLGGFAGLLPDTLDFKFVRYLERRDEEIDPAKLTATSGQPDPQAIAERIAAAMDLAYQSGKRVKVHLHTLRLGAGLWRQYRVAFDLARDEVVVELGPVVTTGQMPLAGSAIPGPHVGRARLQVPILYTYEGEITIDILSGPSLAFDRKGDAVRVIFLPWHRAWTHSLFLAALLGMVGLWIRPAYGSALPAAMAAAMAAAVLAHIVTDQMGYMGNNLLFPPTRQRTPGWKWFHSGEAVPNFLAVWMSLTVILLNLDRFSAAPLIPPVPYLLIVLVLPCLSLIGWCAWTKRPALQPVHRPAEVGATVEALDEVTDVEI
jgi:membrane-bound metal-dependent hydrolase YbcI (DUF457 family)